MHKKTPTMQDVARLAEVSIATVSAVINKTAVVSPKRAERVSKAMEALDYHPDHIARSLKTGRTQTIGIILPDVTNPFYPEVITGAEEVAHANHYSVILCNTNEDPAHELQQLNILFGHRADGVLIGCTDPALSLEGPTKRRFPIVCFDRIPQGFRGDSVSTDNFQGAYEATQHLIHLGHTRIALLVGRTELSTHLARLEGHRKAMVEARLPILGEYSFSGGMEVKTGYDIGLHLLEASNRPSAIFCTNNKLLLGFVTAMRESAVECPRTISVVGYDDFAWTENFYPRLTVVAQPARELGRQAMQLLIKRLRGDVTTPPTQITLKPELRVRESTTPPH
jgi:LacI family transcriptional regulator